MPSRAAAKRGPPIFQASAPVPLYLKLVGFFFRADFGNNLFCRRVATFRVCLCSARIAFKKASQAVGRVFTSLNVWAVAAAASFVARCNMHQPWTRQKMYARRPVLCGRLFLRHRALSFSLHARASEVPDSRT